MGPIEDKLLKAAIMMANINNTPGLVEISKDPLYPATALLGLEVSGSGIFKSLEMILEDDNCNPDLKECMRGLDYSMYRVICDRREQRGKTYVISIEQLRGALDCST